MATQILGKVAYTSRGAYDSSFSYEINDVVTYKGSSYVSKKETKGNLPTNEEYWMLLAEKGATYQVTEEDLNNIANEITADANSVFNQNVTSKTDAFDTNASSQTSSFNENAEKSITAFDSNANEKTTSYNNNATSALSAYNTNHNEKVEAYNTNANTKLEEFNTNASSYDERITDNTNRTKRIENTLYDSGEASGTSINIKDSTLAEFQEISVDGVCKQVTTNGTNLLNFNVNQILDVTPNEDGTITLNGSGGNTLKYEPYTFLANKKYYQKIELVSGTITGVTNSGIMDENGQRFLNLNDVQELSFTEDKTGTGLWVHQTAVYNNARIKLWISEENTDWEPYTGLQPSPSPSYPQNIEVIDEGFEVKSSGKNLLCLEPYTYTSYGITTDFDGNKFKIKGAVSKNWAYLSEEIPLNLEPGEYTLSKYKATLFQLVLNLWNENEQIKSIYLGRGNSKITFNCPSRVTKIILSVDNMIIGEVIDDEVEFQLERGATSTECEAPISSRVPINLPDGEFVGKINENAKDQVRIAFNEDDGEYKPKLSKKLGIYHFTGEELCYYQNENNKNIIAVVTNADFVRPSANYIEGNIICSHFTTEKYYDETDNNIIRKGNGIAISWSANKGIVHIGTKLIKENITLEEFKQYFKENDVYFVYVLAEPYEVDLGEVDMPLSYSPETNVFTTSDLQPNINAKYYRNFINTIQNLQVNEKALKEELVDINNRLSALETNLVNMASVQEVESEVVE